jgi:hypothetical protein
MEMKKSFPEGDISQFMGTDARSRSSALTLQRAEIGQLVCPLQCGVQLLKLSPRRASSKLWKHSEAVCRKAGVTSHALLQQAVRAPQTSKFAAVTQK